MITVQQLQEEARKIQFSGKSSYMLALPKKWVEEMGLRPGDQVMVARQNNTSLIIKAKGAASFGGDRGEVTIELSSKDNAGSLVRKLISLYVVGYNIIHVKGKEGGLTSTQRDVIKEAVRRHLIGTEVVADSISGTTLQVLLSYPQLSVENALKRMFLIAASMHKDAMLALRKLGRDSAKGVIKTDDEVDRFSLYIIRQLKMAVQNPRITKEIGLTNARECLGYRLVTKTVERTADHAVNIARNVLPFQKRVDEEVLKKIERMSEIAISSFETAMESLFKRDFETAENVIEKTEETISLEKEAILSFGETKVEEIANLRLLIESVRRTAEYASDIAEIVLNLTVESILG